MIRNIFFPLITLVGISLLLSGCASRRTTGMDYASCLNGNWELTFITGPRISFEGLYPDKKPELVFDKAGQTVSGSTSCNRLNGRYALKGTALSFSELATTKMFCEGSGESVFLNMLAKVNELRCRDNNEMELLEGDVALMRFKRK